MVCDVACGVPLGREPGCATLGVREGELEDKSVLDGTGLAGVAPLGGGGGRLIMVRSISSAVAQRCSRFGINALVIICSKAGVISGRNERKGGKEKILGLLLAASWCVSRRYIVAPSA